MGAEGWQNRDPNEKIKNKKNVGKGYYYITLSNGNAEREIFNCREVLGIKMKCKNTVKKTRQLTGLLEETVLLEDIRPPFSKNYGQLQM